MYACMKQEQNIHSFLKTESSWLFSLVVLTSKLGNHKWHAFLTVGFFCTLLMVFQSGCSNTSVDGLYFWYKSISRKKPFPSFILLTKLELNQWKLWLCFHCFKWWSAIFREAKVSYVPLPLMRVAHLTVCSWHCWIWWSLNIWCNIN